MTQNSICHHWPGNNSWPSSQRNCSPKLLSLSLPPLVILDTYSMAPPHMYMFLELLFFHRCRQCKCIRLYQVWIKFKNGTPSLFPVVNAKCKKNLKKCFKILWFFFLVLKLCRHKWKELFSISSASKPSFVTVECVAGVVTGARNALGLTEPMSQSRIASNGKTNSTDSARSSPVKFSLFSLRLKPLASPPLTLTHSLSSAYYRWVSPGCCVHPDFDFSL